MARRRKSIFGKLVGAAVIAGAAKIIVDLNKKAKEDDRDNKDVAKEKFNGIVDDAKSGELTDKAMESVGKAKDSIGQFANDVKSGKVAEDIMSGKVAEDVKTKFNETVEKVTSDEFKNEATAFAQNLKEGVVDIFDNKDENNNN